MPADVPDDERLDEKHKKRLTKGRVIGAPFDAYERLFPAYDKGKIFDAGQDLPENPRKMKEALGRSGQMRQLEQALTLPLRAADLEIHKGPEGGEMEMALIDENLMKTDMLNRVFDQATAAVALRHSFFEKEWEVVGSNVYYKDIHWRPPASCEVAWDPKTGRQEGFRQRNPGIDAIILPHKYSSGKGSGAGYVDIPRSRAYIYTHGTHREPVRGLSELDVAYWAYETQQKVLFLWFQFLEGQSLPKILAYGESVDQAEENADAIAAGKASAVIGVERPADPNLKSFDVVESSGNGATQFLEAVNWLDAQMTKSVMATFMDLASITSGKHGSYALSADQSEFFLASRQAVANEMANSIAQGLFRPLCIYNFGPDAKIPKLSVGPLSRQHTERALELLNSVITAETLNVPIGFVGGLIKSTAGYLGLDEEEVHRTVDEYVDRRDALPLKQEVDAEAAAAQRDMHKSAADINTSQTPGKLTKPELADRADQKKKAAKVKGAVDVADHMVRQAKAGKDPKDAAKAVRGGKR